MLLLSDDDLMDDNNNWNKCQNTPVTMRTQKLRQQQSGGHCDCTGLWKATPLTGLCTKVGQVSRPGYPVFVVKDAAS